MGFLGTVLANASSSIGALLLGTVIASTAWLVTHVVDNVMSVPTIEYTVRHPTSNQAEVTLRNLSRQHKFTDLIFLLRLDVPSGTSTPNCNFVRKSPRMIGIPPGYAPNQRATFTSSTVTYPVSGFHPETSLRLIARYHCSEPPRFHIAADSGAARLVRKGFTTWVIRNELEFLFGLVVIWVAVTIGTIRRLPSATQMTGS